MVALLIIGSAILLISCDQGVDSDPQDVKTLMTQQSDTMTIVSSENGMKAYRFYAPLMERYEFANEPYMEFRKGVTIETYQDSTQIVESTLVADYAIFLEEQKLWEAKGNVVAVNSKGQILETQQLYWNQKTKKIYSNVDSKVTQDNDVIVGIGFESDEAFNDFIFRKPKGKVTVDVQPTDSLATDSTSQPGPIAPQPATAKVGTNSTSNQTSSANITSGTNVKADPSNRKYEKYGPNFNKDLVKPTPVSLPDGNKPSR